MSQCIAFFIINILAGGLGAFFGVALYDRVKANSSKKRVILPPKPPIVQNTSLPSDK